MWRSLRRLPNALRRTVPAVRPFEGSLVGRPAIAIESRMKSIAKSLFWPCVTELPRSPERVSDATTERRISMRCPAILAAAAFGAAAVFAAPAAAEATKGRAEVSYSDLDLTAEAGRTELSKRFNQAPPETCDLGDGATPSGRKRYCYERTSRQLDLRVAAILRQKNQAVGG